MVNVENLVLKIREPLQHDRLGIPACMLTYHFYKLCVH